jgi:cytosine/adenosine deaminase-related metal-dependent hydrolase
MSLALTGGTVVTSLDPAVVVSGDLAVTGERVERIGPGATGDQVLDCSGCVVVPGNVVAHHHLYSALARGMPYRLEPPRTFLQVLQRVWWRLDRALDPDSVWLSAWAGGADALLAGTTTIVDHHASPNAIEGSLARVASALRELGVRSVLCEGGPALLGDLIRANLVDELQLVIAARLVAGAEPLTIVTGAALQPPLDLDLLTLHESGGFLFARYGLSASRT